MGRTGTSPEENPPRGMYWANPPLSLSMLAAMLAMTTEGKLHRGSDRQKRPEAVSVISSLSSKVEASVMRVRFKQVSANSHSAVGKSYAELKVSGGGYDTWGKVNRMDQKLLDRFKT